MPIEHLCDHTCRVLRRVESEGDHLDTQVSYQIALAAVPCTFTRRQTVMSNTGTGLQPVGQRRLFISDVTTIFRDRDVIQVYAGPEGYQPIENLEVVSISKPRGHHTELVCEEFHGHMEEEGA